MEDHMSTLTLPGLHMLEGPQPLMEGKNAWLMSRSDYPDIKYWTKEEWVKRQEEDDIETQPGPHRGLQCAKGENIMMKYIESPNGKPVSGAIALDIREYTRSIWRGLYTQGLAPQTWGSVSRTLEDQFNLKMEREWPVLRCCKRHWKVRQLATSIYSQWYSTYHEAQSQQVDRKRKQDDNRAFPATKKSRATLEDEGIEGTDPVDISSSMPLVEDIQEDTSTCTSRPRARPLRNNL
jgi:hypothetical protein